jgi:asparagine synthase (glutamine-hydrolysing)
MNSFVGAWSLDNQPLPVAVLKRMAGQLPAGLGRGTTLHFASTWGVACRTAHAAEEPTPREQQPLRDPQRPCWIAFDGRIDNRADLLAGLASVSHRGPMSDAALGLQAYLAFGTSCAHRLVGDFAFVVVDPQHRTLFCARDIIGARPLFYAVTPRFFYFSSRLRPLLAAFDETPPLDHEYVADYIADDLLVTGRTPYGGISRLLPGHALLLRPGALRCQRYWNLAIPSAGVTTATERGHQEKFLALLTEAVRSRLPTTGPICAELSGGLDSNTILCLAAEILGPDRGRLVPITVVYEEAAHVDERRWTAFSTGKYALTPRYVDGDEHHPFKRLRQAAASSDEPNCLIPTFTLIRCIDDVVGAAGSHVLLSGLGAESVVMDPAAPPMHLADMLRTLRLRRLWRELLRWQAAKKVPLGNLVLDSCLRPILRTALQRGQRVMARRVPSWVNRDFAVRWDLVSRSRRSTTFGYASPADRWQAEMFASLPAAVQAHAGPRPFEVRYPFLHRPLMEYVATLPWTERLDPLVSKPLLRRSLEGILPEEIRTRADKTTFGQSFFLSASAERRQLAQLIEDPIVARLGIVSSRALSDALSLARCGHADDTPRLLSCIGLEAWLRWGYGSLEPHREAGAVHPDEPALERADGVSSVWTQ